MNKVVQDMLMHTGVSILDGAEIGSGRYRLGSGENPYQRPSDILDRVERIKWELEQEGKKPTLSNIAEKMGMFNKYGKPETTKLDHMLSNARDARKLERYYQVMELHDKGYGDSEIARMLGIKNESTVRGIRDQERAARLSTARNTADVIKNRIEELAKESEGGIGMVNVGPFAAESLGVTEGKLGKALELLKDEGYVLIDDSVRQMSNIENRTTLKILASPNTTTDYFRNHMDEVKFVDPNLVSRNNGESFEPRNVYPASLDSKRLQIRYADDEISGKDRDGLIEIRRNVPDLSLGKSVYSQVRILVDDRLYLKGMAVYSDDLPPGIDVRFNTNKTSDKPLDEVLKKIDLKDPENPFKSTIKDIGDGGQYYYTDKDGNQKLGLINKRSDEGDVEKWSKKLPTQFMAKQSEGLIRRQIALSESEKMEEFEKIMSLTNATLKKTLLYDFASDCDSAAETMSVCALPGQKWGYLLPAPSLKDNECYCPNMPDGETVALIRYPHAGLFEIPILKVNNKNPEARAMIGTHAQDAICINPKTAATLSGADYDGDTCTIIPCNSSKSTVKIMSRPRVGDLAELNGFDPQEAYPGIKGVTKVLPKDKVGLEMGTITNLIADMTAVGAEDSELVRAVKHSMVIIDANKHELDYVRSAKENRINELKKKYQKHEDGRTGGATTIFTRATNKRDIRKRRGTPKIDPETGKLLYKDSNEKYYDKKKGEWVYRTQKATQMSQHDDAHELSSGTLKEELYADYANFYKNLANRARLESDRTQNTPYNKEMAVVFDNEVHSLNQKLLKAKSNKPKETQAQLTSRARYHVWLQARQNEGIEVDKEERRKRRDLELKKARKEFGAERNEIFFTDREWQAIQNGALPPTTVKQIYQYANSEELRKKATPNPPSELTPTQKRFITNLKNAGFENMTNSQIAERIGVSVSLVNKYIHEKEGEQ